MSPEPLKTDRFFPTFGERIGPAWAFFAIGLFGLHHIFAVPFGYFAILGALELFKFAPLHFRLLSMELGLGVTIGLICLPIYLVLSLFPARVIWTSTRRVSKKWLWILLRFHVLGGLLISLLAPPSFTVLLLHSAFEVRTTPKLAINDDDFIKEAKSSAKFDHFFDVPNGAETILSVYYKYPVLDFEFDNSLILILNEKEWADIQKTDAYKKALSGTTYISDFQHNHESGCPILQAPSLCQYLEKPFEVTFSLNMPRNDRWSKVLFFDDDQVLFIQIQQN